MKINFFVLLLFVILSAQSTAPVFAQRGGARPDPWIIKTGPLDAMNYYGETVANGMIGVVSSPEPFRVKSVVLAGAYDLYGRGRVSNFIASFNLVNMYLEIDGRRVDKKNIQQYQQVLNMKEASMTTSFEVGDQAHIEYTTYALRQLPFSILTDLVITAKKAISITAASVMEGPDNLKDIQNYYNEIDRPHTTIQLLTSSAKSPTGRLEVCASNSFIFPETHGLEPRVIHEMWDNNMHLMKFTKSLRSGQAYNYAVVGTSITSAHHPDPLNEAERLTLFAKLEGKKRLIEHHKEAWNTLWKSDIQIEGDPQAQQDLHSMLYHLYSFTREGSMYSSSPMGLSGLGYNGHIFWDADLWMFPALLVLHPELAKSMIDYRFNRLENARKNALSHGYRGAMFPWESAETGVEETPVWALSGPFEHHITACVGLAAWNYYCLTQDTGWLKTTGWPLLSSTARFWASRVEKNRTGGYDIKNVVAADEWAENVDNDAFTNGAARANLEAAIKAAAVVGQEPDADWQEISRNIPILKFPNGVTREHATYHGEGIKQGDVNLLAYPLKYIVDPTQIAADLAYYETRVPTEGTPAMTQAIFGLLYARLGNGEKAYHFFKDAYEPNLNPPFRVIAETKGGTNPYFATGAGGVLQCVLMGFGGLDITPTGLKQVSSRLPSRWKSLTITGAGPEKRTYIIH